MREKENTRLENFLKKEVRSEQELFPLEESYFDNLSAKTNDFKKPIHRKLSVTYIAWASSVAAVIALFILVNLNRSDDATTVSIEPIKVELPNDIFMEETVIPELNNISIPNNNIAEAIIVRENISLEMLVETEKSSTLLEGITNEEIEDYLIDENTLLTEL